MTNFKTIGPACTLGEGPLWHPVRERLFWFDIPKGELYSCNAFGGQPRSWNFGEPASAAGWVDKNTLVVATASGIQKFDLLNGSWETLVELEADNQVTRSNDGRVGPGGAFWIGTMGKNIEAGAGAIYRFYKGQLRQIFDQLTIPNAVCFAPDGKVAYFTDTLTQIIHKQPVDKDGWPQGKPQVFADLRAEGLFPDGAVVDDAGHLWNAQWGASRVARYAPDGSFVSAVEFPAQQISCPAFGGSGLDRLFATSAADGLPEDQADQGKTFVIQTTIKGQQEHQVLL